MHIVSFLLERVMREERKVENDKFERALPRWLACVMRLLIKLKFKSHPKPLNWKDNNFSREKHTFLCNH
jgi:hypothetical protein